MSALGMLVRGEMAKTDDAGDDSFVLLGIDCE
jgi:hypothetical protein